MKGGRFPGRVEVPRLKGQVMQRLDKAGHKLTRVRSMVRIPHEMALGHTRAAFEQTAAPPLHQRVEAMLIKRL